MKRYTIVALICIIIPLALATIAYVSSCFGLCDNVKLLLKPDAVYTGGATLIGLATFGSVIGARAVTGGDKKREGVGALMMLGGSIGVMVMQGVLMMNVCCIGLYAQTLYSCVLATVVYSALIIIGFSLIVSRQFAPIPE